MSSRARGVSLLELIVSMSLLSVFLILMFSAFDLGTRIFQESSVRQSSEIQLRSIKVLLERDAKLTNFWYTNTIPRTTADGTRDAVAMATVRDWRDPGSYDGATQRPLWDRYIVWYATLGPSGSLHRQVIEPALAGPSLTTPYANLGANLSDANPLSNADVVFSRILSANVVDFEVSPRLQNGTLTAKVNLLSTGRKRALGSDQTVDHLEVKLTFQPKNTWPAI